jgi:hypothetical protein
MHSTPTKIPGLLYIHFQKSALSVEEKTLTNLRVISEFLRDLLFQFSSTEYFRLTNLRLTFLS